MKPMRKCSPAGYLVVAYGSVGMNEEIDGMKLFLHTIRFILYHPAEEMLPQVSATLLCSSALNSANTCG